MFSAVHFSLNFITYHLPAPLLIMSQSKILTFLSVPLRQVAGQALQKQGKRTASHNQIWSQEQTLTAVDQETKVIIGVLFTIGGIPLVG